MKQSTLVGLVLILVLALGIGTYAFFQSRDNDNGATENRETTTPVDEEDDLGRLDNEPDESAEVIGYTNTGFDPSGISVGSGSTILIQNDSSIDLQFSSDPHPAHTDNTELNIPILRPGESATITLQNTGSWGFHNHLQAAHTGTVNVE